ncbi:MAG: DUF2971 domain-containing protein [Acidobacteriota bacterium]
MIVYKYLHPDRIDVLENSAIRFTQPAALNDPFETMPRLNLFKEYLKEELTRRFRQGFGSNLPSQIESIRPSIIDEQLAEPRKQWGEYFGILSLTKKNSNALMWAHYADSHRGFVIGFDSNSPFFKPGNGKARDGLREVKYAADRGVVPRRGLSSLDDDELGEVNDLFFFTKSDRWFYEEEIRILALPPTASRNIKVAGGCDICLFEFPPECVKEVILGYQMPSDKKQAVVDIVTGKYCHAALFQAALSEYSYDLDIVRYSA